MLSFFLEIDVFVVFRIKQATNQLLETWEIGRKDRAPLAPSCICCAWPWCRKSGTLSSMITSTNLATSPSWSEPRRWPNSCARSRGITREWPPERRKISTTFKRLNILAFEFLPSVIILKMFSFCIINICAKAIPKQDYHVGQKFKCLNADKYIAIMWLSERFSKEPCLSRRSVRVTVGALK